MSDFARVDSIDSLRDFRTGLVKFQEIAQVALGDAESELSRTLMWLETEQTAYWAGQIRKRQEWVGRCAEKLREKRLFKDSSGRVPSAVDEEKALRVAKARLEEALEKQIVVKKYIRLVQKAIHDYKGSVQSFTTAVAHDIPVSIAKLDKLTGILRQYVELAAPGSAGVEEGALASGEGMGRLDNAPDAAVLKAGAPAEDLPDFPEIASPQVVLFHTHLPTSLILAADGKTPAEEGNQYMRFPDLAAADEYARAKVKADPVIECAIYGHERTRLKTVAASAAE